MIPIGYMYKRAFRQQGLLEMLKVEDLYSVSDCLAEPFADYSPFFRHNGHGLFDSPAVMRALAAELSISLEDLALFYYEAHEAQYDEEQARWIPITPEASLPTDVEPPTARTLEGFDVVTWNSGAGAECSPLSCNGIAEEVPTNMHCLLPSLEAAVQAIESGKFANSEPGPFRIIAVYSVGTG